jgi:hypothetical protein
MGTKECRDYVGCKIVKNAFSTEVHSSVYVVDGRMI